MKSRKYAYVGIAIAAAAVAVLAMSQFDLFSHVDNDKVQSNGVAFLDFSYDEANSDIRTVLLANHLNMTKPIRLSSASDVAQYCDFLTDPKKQALVTYCTSTVIKDSRGQFLGNVNMVGTPDLPGLVVVALQSNPVFNNYNDVQTVFSATLNSTTCQCWNDEHPGGYQSLSTMLDTIKQSHLDTKQPTTSTHVFSLGNKHFKIELTTNTSGYLWKLLVSK